MRFTPNQKALIECAGHSVGVAGPGSGKSTTIVEKIARLVEQPSARVVALTFTREAATELRHRIERRITDATQRQRVSALTFHALLLAHRKIHGLRDRLVDSEEVPRRLSYALESCGIDKAEVRNYLETLEACKSTLDDRPEHREAWYLAYQEGLHRAGKMDMYDLVRDSLRRFKDGQMPLPQITHLINDEAQDTDALQFAFIRLLAERGTWVTLVADDDQTIYEWRHALGFAGLESFMRDFGAQRINLTDNFRSRAEIVQASDALIRNNLMRLAKNPTPMRPGGGVLQIVVSSDLRKQAANIALRLADASFPGADHSNPKVTRKVKTGEFAVLARNNFALNFIEAELAKLGVKIYRPSGSIWRTAAANLYFSCVEAIVAATPDRVHDLLYTLGIKADVVQRVLKTYGSDLGAVLENRGNWGEFGTSAEALSTACASIAFINGCRSRGEYFDMFHQLAACVCQAFPADSPSDKGARQIVDTAAALIHRIKGPVMGRIAFLKNASEQRDSEEAVGVFTMHGAKGLEFENVFILGADQSSIPGKSSDFEAERRLFYVAMTRAKDRLHIYHDAGGPSRYVKELPLGLFLVTVADTPKTTQQAG